MECSVCGAQIHEGDKFCTSCGSPVYQTDSVPGKNTQVAAGDLSAVCYNQPISNTEDGTGYWDYREMSSLSKVSHVMGILSLVFMFSFGSIFAIIGIINGAKYKSKKFPYSGKASAGLTMSIIGLIINGSSWMFLILMVVIGTIQDLSSIHF